MLCHNLDVMHIKKNVFENLIYTLLNETRRTKDRLNTWRDLQVISIRKDLWPNDKGKYQPCLFTMTNTMKDAFFKVLKNVKMPDGYSSNISKCIDLK